MPCAEVESSSEGKRSDGGSTYVKNKIINERDDAGEIINEYEILDHAEVE